MNQQRNALIAAKLGQALRDRIGEQRFNTWFVTTGARLEARDDAIVVKVDDFYAHFLQSSFKSTIDEIAENVLDDSRPVVFETYQTAAPVPSLVAAPARPEVQQPTLLPFPPNNDARRVAPRTPQTSVFDVPEPVQDQPVQPPKRKRGRPRKNPAPTPVVPDVPQAAAPTFPQPTNATPVFGYVAPGVREFPNQLFPATGYPTAPANPAPATFLPDASGVAPQPAAETAPPKRKRGRPRKNPAPTPTVPEPPAVSFPFADAYNRSLLTPQTAVPAAPTAVAQPGTPTADFSDDERAIVSLGTFADAPTLAEPQETPRRRGRPKGSVNRAKLASETVQEDGVARDSNGYNISSAPKRKPQIRTDEGESRRFASLRTFAVGPSNNMAIKMLELVVTAPGTMSPMYIHGPTSVGKTRLLEGVCEAFLHLPTAQTRPPLYMTADQFTTQFTSYVAGGVRAPQKFRDRFRNISLFALDDLQFLEGKRATQIELVKTLDSLRALGIQVVISGAAPLVDMTFLREELTTRIQSGLTAEISPPERETLAAILRQIAAERSLVVPDDVCRYVVSRFATHAREVIGAVNRLYATHLATGEPVTLDFAREALAGLAPVSHRNIRLEDVERVVQETFALEPNALKSSSRARKNADPRAVAMWLARKHTRAALAEIGAYFGGRRHSAVLSAQKKVEGWLNENAALANGDAPDRPVADLLKSLERALSTARL